MFFCRMWSDQIVAYYSSLRCPKIPAQYECMNPYLSESTMQVVKEFASKFLNDNNKRTLLFGINPGRFGSGITGISFTDPVRLKSALGIDHSFDMRPELSSEFIYKMIEQFGGPEVFYARFFISAAYPLGFLHQGKNINYYEFDRWKVVMQSEIVEQMNQHMAFNINRNCAFCIGKGENFKVLSELNRKHDWFEKIEPLPHPRWVLQYKRRFELDYIDEYIQKLKEAIVD